VEELRQLAGEFTGRAAFAAVYITEAHARDEWPVGPKVSFCDQPKTLSERLALADKLNKSIDFALPVVVDGMENAFMKTFAAWPFRYYIIHNGKVALKGQPLLDKFGYDLDADLRAWFAEH